MAQGTAWGEFVGWRVVGVGVTAAVALAAVGCADGGVVVSEGERTYSIAEPVRVVAVEAQAARVTVQAGTSQIMVVERFMFGDERPATSHEVVDETLRLVERGCGGGVNIRCEIEYEITVPPDVAVRVTTRAGQVTVQGLMGDLTVDTDAGAVRAMNLRSASVDVATRAGLVELSFAEAPRDVAVQTDAGAIDVVVPEDERYAVEVITDLGTADVTVDRDPDADRRIWAKTNVGSVTVRPG